MANRDAPFGLRPRCESAVPRRYWMVSGAAAVGQGAMVSMAGGVVTVATASNTALLGVCAAFVSVAKPTEATAGPDWGAELYGSGILRKAIYVYDNPEEIFVVQSDGAMAVGGLTSYVGGYFTYVNASTKSGTQSIGELDATGTNRYKKAPALLNQLWCVGGADEIGSNDYDASWCNLLVKINPNMHVHANKITKT